MICNRGCSEHNWRRFLATFIVLVLSLALLALAHPTPAWSADKDTEHVIDIQLVDESESSDDLKLGDSLSRSFKVISQEDDCYVRLDMCLSALGAELKDAYRSSQSSEWRSFDDGKWYCMTPIAKGQSVRLDVLMEPSGKELSDRAASGDQLQLKEVVTAEAIDASAVTPNWQNGLPWGAVGAPPAQDTDRIDSVGGVSGDVGESGTVDEGLSASGGSHDGLTIARATLGSTSGSNPSKLVSGLAATGDLSALEMVLIVASISALLLLVIDILYHRYKCKQEKSVSKIRYACLKKRIR